MRHIQHIAVINRPVSRWTRMCNHVDVVIMVALGNAWIGNQLVINALTLLMRNAIIARLAADSCPWACEATKRVLNTWKAKTVGHRRNHVSEMTAIGELMSLVQ